MPSHVRTTAQKSDVLWRRNMVDESKHWIDGEKPLPDCTQGDGSTREQRQDTHGETDKERVKWGKTDERQVKLNGKSTKEVRNTKQ